MLLSLITGVIVQFYSELQLTFNYLFFALLGLIVCALPIFYDRSVLKFLRSFLFGFVFYTLGFFLSYWHNFLNSSHYFERLETNQRCIVQITEAPQEKMSSIKLVGEVLQAGDKSAVGKVLLYLEKDSAAKALEYGDRIEVSAPFYEIKQNKNPKEFDYKRYLKIHNIHHQAYANSGSWQFQDKGGSALLKSIYTIREWCEQKIAESGMSDQNVMVAEALILGQKDRLDKDTLRSYSSAGAMHVLAVSGLHVGIIMLIVGAVVKPIKRWRKGRILYLLIVLLSLWFYAIITGLSPSVLRSAIMFSFVVLGLELQRTTSIYQSLLVSAFVLIVLDPWVIFQVGFQLSYLAVIGIVYLQPKIYAYWYFSARVSDWIWKITSVSLAAQFATFPLGLYYFHQFPNFFLISNLLVIPLAFVILLSGISFLIFSFVPFLSELLIWIFDLLLTVLNSGVKWIEGLPHSIYWGISIQWYEVFWIYTILVGIVVWLRLKIKSVFWLTGFSVVALFANWTYQNYLLSHENKLFVYNIKDEVAIDIFKGSENRFYCSDELFNNEQKLLFHVMHNWFYRTGREYPTAHSNSAHLQFLHFGDQSLQIIDGTKKIPMEFNSNYILLHGFKGQDDSFCQKLRSYRGTVLLGANMSRQAKEYFKEGLLYSKVVDISDGAFEITF